MLVCPGTDPDPGITLSSFKTLELIPRNNVKQEEKLEPEKSSPRWQNVFIVCRKLSLG